MLFNSYTFIVFLALVLVINRIHFPWRARKLFLLAASYLFYAAWNPPFVVLLWLSTLVDWFCASRIHRTERSTSRRVFLLLSLVVNLGLLAFFKYGTFVLENFVVLLQMLGIKFQPAAPSIILPVGISFYTFQTLSYTLDVYRGVMRPWHSFLDYAMYVTFFPQLVAGPIVRARDFLPQCDEPRRANSAQLGWGLSLLVVGLFNKIVIADTLMAPIVEMVYDAGRAVSFSTAWTGTIAFAVQIFCDFAGYSTCAIGVALCLGFSLPDNFRFPYAAIGFSDFWRRWHISLSTWLRDYLYIPLGGNRQGRLRTCANLMITMLIGGLWHGASWTFVVWGGLHGFYLLIERLLRRYVPPWKIWEWIPIQLGLAGLTFVIVCFTWVFFRSGSFQTAFSFASAMLGCSESASVLSIRLIMISRVALVTTLLLVLHWFLRNHSLEYAAQRLPWPIRVVCLSTMILLIASAVSGKSHAFIYFQF